MKGKLSKKKKIFFLEVPFGCETNMIKIDGEDIKKKMLKICDTIIELYSEAIYEYTFKRNT